MRPKPEFGRAVGRAEIAEGDVGNYKERTLSEDQKESIHGLKGADLRMEEGDILVYRLPQPMCARQCIVTRHEIPDGLSSKIAGLHQHLKNDKEALKETNIFIS